MPSDIRSFFGGGGPKKPAANGGGNAKPKDEPAAAKIKSPPKAPPKSSPNVDMVDLTDADAKKTTPRVAAPKRKLVVDVRVFPRPHPINPKLPPQISDSHSKKTRC